jgi:hypothetical protein
MPLDILLVSILRSLVEVAGFALLGQGVLVLLAGKYREQNIFYRTLRIVTHPVVRGVRFITPRFILDAHVPVLTFFLLFWLWISCWHSPNATCAACMDWRAKRVFLDSRGASWLNCALFWPVSSVGRAAD